MRIETLRNKNLKKTKFTKNGPFGIFTKKLEHKNDPNVAEFLKKIENDIVQRSIKYREFSIFRDWSFFENMPCHTLGLLRYKRFLMKDSSEKRFCTSANDSILNYYLYKKISIEEKEKLCHLYESRFDVPIEIGFSKDYLKTNPNETLKKSDFILWMNYYLQNNVSEDFLELDSFEIVIKLGQLWNELPYRERREWRLLALEDQHWRKKSRLKLYNEVIED